MHLPGPARALAIACSLALALPAAAGPEWRVDRLVPGALFKGIHGLGFGPDGRIYIGSVVGQEMYRVDPESGDAEIYLPPTAGLADDIEFAPDGTLYFTGFMQGSLKVKSPGGGVRVIASGLPGLNSLALDARGRLFATQVFAGDALWELDPTAQVAPRKVMEGMGGLNGFDFGPDGRLCGPLWFKGQVVCIDVDSGALEVVAEGFRVPAAANFNSKGELFAIDNETGEIFRIDRQAKTRTRVAQAPTNLDNLAFDATDRLFVSNMADNAIYEIDLAGGPVRTVASSPLSRPGGIGIAGGTLYVADTFALSAVNLADGAVRDISRLLSESGYPTTLGVSAQRIASASFEAGGVLLRDRTTEKLLAHWQGLAAPSAVAVLDDNRIAVTEMGAGGRLLLLDARDSTARTVLAEGLMQPMGLVFREGRYYLSESAAGRIVEIAAEGARRVVCEGLAQPEGLALMPDGRLAVAETGSGRLLLLSTVDGATEVAARELPLGIPDIAGMPPGAFPTGVAVAPDGTIYLSSDREGSILRVAPPVEAKP